MATQARGKKPASKVGSSSSDYPIPPLPLAVAPADKSVGEDIVAAILLCVFMALMLPLGAMLYLDILEAKHQVNVQLEKVEKLRRQVEQQQRKGNKDD